MTIVFSLFCCISTYAQQTTIDSANSYSKKAFSAFSKNNYAECLGWYEKLFSLPLKNYRSNYNLYRASISACQVNDAEKSLMYFKEMCDVFLDYGNYPTFLEDSSKLECITKTAIWKNAMAFMKPKYDSVEKRVSDFAISIKDTSLRLNYSNLSDSTLFGNFKSGLTFNEAYLKLKNYNNFSEVPKTNHWALYQMKLNDTLTIPYLIFIPEKYNPKVKTPLYIFLHGAAGQRTEFSTMQPLFETEEIYLKKPIEQNAFILYPLARKDINWLYHPMAFQAITKEIAFLKSLYNINDNKVFATGHSDGGRGVFYFALNKSTDFASYLALNFFPQSLISNTSLRNFKNDKIFYGITGTKDETFPYKKVDSIYKYAKSIGSNWTNYFFEAGHSLPMDNPELINFIYDTLINKVRNPFPKNIQWETNNIVNGRYLWIEITKMDTTLNKANWADTYNPIVKTKDNSSNINFNQNKTAIIKVAIDGNNVTVNTSCVTEFTFYVYPELVDINKPIKFIVNNKTLFTVIPKGNKDNLIFEFAKMRDRTMLPIEKITLGFEN